MLIGGTSCRRPPLAGKGKVSYLRALTGRVLKRAIQDQDVGRLFSRGEEKRCWLARRETNISRVNRIAENRLFYVPPPQGTLDSCK